jgi:hypothetical protein
MMMLRRSLALFALAGAAACAGRAKPTPEALAGVPEGEYPLEAWLSYQRVSDLAFTVNQPAHVAIFHIAPGRGVSMLYPTYRDELDRTDPGYNVPGYRYDSGRWYFLNSSFTRLASSPTYLLLVASREPLRVSEYERHPGMLRRALGPNTFASYDEWDVIDELTQLIVPPQPDDAWSTDLVVLWPGMRANSMYAANDYFGSGQLVRCDNGRIIMVPESYPYGGCPFFSTYRPLPSTPLPQQPQPEPEQPSDSAGTPEPGTPGDKPLRPEPIDPEAESAHPKRGTPRRAREVESGAESVRIAGETRRAGRRTRQAYAESSDERGAGAWDRGAASYTTPRMTTGSPSSGRASRAGRGSARSSGAGSQPVPRSTRSEPRSEPSSPAVRERSSSDRPASTERPASSTTERPSSERPARP